MQARPEFPHPAPNAQDAPFWEWCRRRELRVQRCTACGAYRHHPRPRCPECRASGYEWAPVSGRGTVHSYTICHPPVLPAFASRAPYNAVVVRLDEGPFLVSNVVDCADGDIAVGMEVEVTFVPVDDELTLPQFRPRTMRH
jgi:uncharacterized OB-fold protein